MNKPVYLKPFILLYKMFVLLFKFIARIIKYINVGLFFTIYMFCYLIISTVSLIYDLVLYIFVFICRMLYRFIKYIALGLFFTFYIVFDLIWFIFINLCHFVYKIFYYAKDGFIVLSYLVYRLFRYEINGYVFIYVLLSRKIDVLNKNKEKLRVEKQKEKEKKDSIRDINNQIQEENRKRLAEIKRKEQEELAKQQLEKNKKIVIEKEKKQVKQKKGFFATIKEKFFSKKKEMDINRKALLLDFEGTDAEKSSEKIMYKYIAKNPEGKLIRGNFPAHSKVEVHSFLLSEGNEVYSIEVDKLTMLLNKNAVNAGGTRIKTKDLIFFTTQLSTYIKAGIPLVDSLKILSRQFKNKAYSRIFRSAIYDLTMGDSFSSALDKQGNAFPRLLINMVKASEMTGELPEVLDDMAEYFTESDKTKKQMVTAMTYPTIIFILAIAAVAFIMVWVVPKFVTIYEGIDGAQIPGITLFVMGASAFLQNSWVFLLLGITIFIVVFIVLYKNVKAFKSGVQWFLMHLPVFGKVIIYNEVTMFTKTFASLLAHNVFITDSMDILKKLTNNEVYKSLIFETIDNLSKGEKISLAFKDHWAFPIPAYEMITTGERTGQLPEMMTKVSAYYQELHKNSVTRIKTFIEPALIIFLTVVVGGIVLAIVIPMFSVYGAIQV